MSTTDERQEELFLDLCDLFMQAEFNGSSSETIEREVNMDPDRIRHTSSCARRYAAAALALVQEPYVVK